MDDATQCLLDVIGDPDALTQFLDSSDGPAHWDPSTLPDSTTPDIPPFDPSLFGGVDDEDEVVGMGVDLPASLEDTIISHSFGCNDPTLSSCASYSHSASPLPTTSSNTASLQSHHQSPQSVIGGSAEHAVMYLPTSYTRSSVQPRSQPQQTPVYLQQQQTGQQQQQTKTQQQQQAQNQTQQQQQLTQLQQHQQTIQQQQSRQQQILLQQQLIHKLQQLQPIGPATCISNTNTTTTVQIQAGKIGQPQVQLSTSVAPVRPQSSRTQGINIGSLLPSASQTLVNMAHGQRVPQNGSQNQTILPEATSANITQLQQQQHNTTRVQQQTQVVSQNSVQLSTGTTTLSQSTETASVPVQATLAGRKVLINDQQISLEDLQRLKAGLMNPSQLVPTRTPLQVQFQPMATPKSQTPVSGTVHHMPTTTSAPQAVSSVANSLHGSTLLSGATTQAGIQQLPHGTVITGLPSQGGIQGTNILPGSQANITGLPSGTVLQSQGGIAGLQGATVITGLAQPAMINVATPQGPQQLLLQKALSGLQGQPGVILRTVGTNLVQIPQPGTHQGAVQHSSVPQQLVVNLNSLNQLQQQQQATQITQIQPQTSTSLSTIQLPAGTPQFVQAASLPQHIQSVASTVTSASTDSHASGSQQQPQVINVHSGHVQLQSPELQQKTQVAGNVTLNISGQTVNVQNVHQLKGMSVQNMKSLPGLHVNAATQGNSQEQTTPVSTSILPQINVGNVQVKNQQVINNPQVISNPQLFNPIINPQVNLNNPQLIQTSQVSLASLVSNTSLQHTAATVNKPVLIPQSQISGASVGNSIQIGSRTLVTGTSTGPKTITVTPQQYQQYQQLLLKQYQLQQQQQKGVVTSLAPTTTTTTTAGVQNVIFSHGVQLQPIQPAPLSTTSVVPSVSAVGSPQQVDTTSLASSGSAVLLQNTLSNMLSQMAAKQKLGTIVKTQTQQQVQQNNAVSTQFTSQNPTLSAAHNSAVLTQQKSTIVNQKLVRQIDSNGGLVIQRPLLSPSPLAPKPSVVGSTLSSPVVSSPVPSPSPHHAGTMHHTKLQTTHIAIQPKSTTPVATSLGCVSPGMVVMPANAVNLGSIANASAQVVAPNVNIQTLGLSSKIPALTQSAKLPSQPASMTNSGQNITVTLGQGVQHSKQTILQLQQLQQLQLRQHQIQLQQKQPQQQLLASGSSAPSPNTNHQTITLPALSSTTILPSMTTVSFATSTTPSLSGPIPSTHNPSTSNSHSPLFAQFPLLSQQVSLQNSVSGQQPQVMSQLSMPPPSPVIPVQSPKPSTHSQFTSPSQSPMLSPMPAPSPIPSPMHALPSNPAQSPMSIQSPHPVQSPKPPPSPLQSQILPPSSPMTSHTNHYHALSPAATSVSMASPSPHQPTSSESSSDTTPVPTTPKSAKLPTIQLSPDLQQNLVSIQQRIRSIMSKKERSPAEQDALERLSQMQQKILNQGRLQAYHLLQKHQQQYILQQRQKEQQRQQQQIQQQQHQSGVNTSGGGQPTIATLLAEGREQAKVAQQAADLAASQQCQTASNVQQTQFIQTSTLPHASPVTVAPSQTFVTATLVVQQTPPVSTVQSNTTITTVTQAPAQPLQPKPDGLSLSQLPPALRDRLQAQLAKMTPEQQQWFYKNQTTIILKLQQQQQQLIQQQQQQQQHQQQQQEAEILKQRLQRPVQEMVPTVATSSVAANVSTSNIAGAGGPVTITLQQVNSQGQTEMKPVQLQSLPAGTIATVAGRNITILPASQASQLQTVTLKNVGEITTSGIGSLEKTATVAPAPAIRKPVAPTRKQIFQLYTTRDQKRAVECDHKTPFTSFKDILKRLLAFHTNQVYEASEEELDAGETLFEEVSDGLLDCQHRMMAKYQGLILNDSLRTGSTAEMVMLERMFLEGEQTLLKSERQQVLQDPEHFVPKPVLKKEVIEAEVVSDDDDDDEDEDIASVDNSPYQCTKREPQDLPMMDAVKSEPSSFVVKQEPEDNIVNDRGYSLTGSGAVKREREDDDDVISLSKRICMNVPSSGGGGGDVPFSSYEAKPPPSLHSASEIGSGDAPSIHSSNLTESDAAIAGLLSSSDYDLPASASPMQEQPEAKLVHTHSQPHMDLGLNELDSDLNVFHNSDFYSNGHSKTEDCDKVDNLGYQSDPKEEEEMQSAINSILSLEDQQHQRLGNNMDLAGSLGDFGNYVDSDQYMSEQDQEDLDAAIKSIL